MRGIILFLILFIHFYPLKIYSMANPPLPEGICEQVVPRDRGISISKCKQETHQSTGAQYIDLNNDGISEIVFSMGSHSCGSMYWIFKLNNQAQWKYLGYFCGCDWDGEGKLPIRTDNTKMNGFKVIKTCGVSGFFNGKEYDGQPQ